MVAPLAAALLAVLVGAAAAGPAALVVLVVAVAQVGLAVRWTGALGAPAAVETAVVGAGVAVGADLAVWLSDDERPLGLVAPALGLGLLAAIVGQVLRRDGRVRLTASLAAGVSLCVAGALGATYVVLRQADGGVPFLVAGALAAGAAVALVTAPGPLSARLLRTAAGLVAAAVVGLVVGASSDAGVLDGLLTGLVCGAAALVVLVTAQRMPRPDPLVAGVLPLLLVAPVAFVGFRLLTG